MLDDKIFNMIPGLDLEEFQFLKEVTKDLREEQMQTFLSIYNGKRQKPDTVLICALIGLLGIGGVQRFLLNQIGMGILFLLTAGLCYIGTIVDIVNYKRLALEYNQEMAYEAVRMTQSIS
jgi:TM2 domain-containing membrane protein YozV